MPKGGFSLDGTYAWSEEELEIKNTAYIRNKMEQQTELMRRQTEAMEQANRPSYQLTRINVVNNDYLERIERKKKIKEADKEFKRKLAIKQVEEKLGISEEDLRKWFSKYSGAVVIDLANRVVDLKASIKIITKKLDTAIFFRKRLQKRLDELNIEYEQKYKECLEYGQEDLKILDNFRKTHYCKEAEDLIEKLDLHFSKIEGDYREGTIEDYSKFIKEDLKKM